MTSLSIGEKPAVGDRSWSGMGLLITWCWMCSIGVLASKGSLPVSTS
jgi:hypothetical protein